MRVLLAHADPDGARTLALLLKRSDMAVEHAASGGDAVDLAKHYDFDVVLLDDRLRDMGDVAAVRRLRAAGVSTPALVMSEADAEGRVRAFDAGADDVLSKPFSNDELVARIRTLVRRSRGHSEPLLQAGPLTLNLNTREVSANGAPLRLTGKEYAILELLVLRRGSLITRDALMTRLYDAADEPDVKVIDVFVCKLRKKLSQGGAAGVVSTAWGRGYIVRKDGEPGHPTRLRASPSLPLAAAPPSWSNGQPLGGAAAA